MNGQNGKGSRPRKVDGDKYRAHWDAIFSKPRQSKAEATWSKVMKPAMNATREPLTYCAADRDGECHHPDCPNIRDGEPEKTGRHCPLIYRDRGEEY